MRRVLAFFALLLVVGIPGCTNSVPVDHDGDPATPARQMDEAAIARWELTEAENAKRREAEAKAEAEREIARAQRDAERAVRRAVSLNEETVRDIEDSLADRIDAAATSLARTKLDTESQVRRIADAAEDARAAIAAQNAWVGSVGAILGDPATGALASMIPGGGAILGLLGAGFGLFQRHAKVKTERTASRVIDSIDVLKTKNPAVAQAFKENAVLLNQWQGEAGAALVSKLQMGA